MRLATIISLIIAAGTLHVRAADKRPGYLKHLQGVPRFAISPDGKTLVHGGDGIAYIDDFKTLKRKHKIPVERVIMDERGIRRFSGGPIAIAFSPDGKTVALMNRFAEIQVHDLATGTRTGAVLFPKRIEALLGVPGPSVFQIRFSPDGKTLALLVVNRLALFETRTGKHRKTIKGVCGFVATNDGRFLAVKAKGVFSPIEPAIKVSPDIINLATGKSVGKLKLMNPMNTPNGVVFSQDGRLVAFAGRSGVVVWDVKTGKQKQAFQGNAKESFECGIKFSSNGKIVVVASVDQTDGIAFRIRAWNLATGRIVLKKESRRKPPQILGATPGGNAMMYRFGTTGRIELFRFRDSK